MSGFLKWFQQRYEHLSNSALCAAFRPGRLTKLVDDLMTTTIKRAVMNPAYMHAAWEQEADNIRDFGATPEEMLVRP